jgi:hypothetical protein
LHYITKSPKRLFLIDGLGAFITAFVIFFILRPFHEYIGLSPVLLLLLSIIAFMFSFYSFINFFFFQKNWIPYLRIIGIANTMYCLLTASLMLHYFHSLKIVGLLYFTLEIVVIAILIWIEFKTIKTIRSTPKSGT